MVLLSIQFFLELIFTLYKNHRALTFNVNLVNDSEITELWEVHDDFFRAHVNKNSTW